MAVDTVFGRWLSRQSVPSRPPSLDAMMASGRAREGLLDLAKRGDRGIFVHLPLWFLIAIWTELWAQHPLFCVINALIFGANDGVVVVGHSADVYDPQTVRASQGALFAIPVVRVESSEELEPRIEGLRVVGTSARGDRDLGEADLRGGVALALGNKTKGLSWAWRERADLLVRIPQYGSVSSLNLAAAAAVVLYEARRQRRGPAA